jgi:hypothetical protein
MIGQLDTALSGMAQGIARATNGYTMIFHASAVPDDDVGIAYFQCVHPCQVSRVLLTSVSTEHPQRSAQAKPSGSAGLRLIPSSLPGSNIMPAPVFSVSNRLMCGTSG